MGPGLPDMRFRRKETVRTVSKINCQKAFEGVGTFLEKFPQKIVTQTNSLEKFPHKSLRKRTFRRKTHPQKIENFGAFGRFVQIGENIFFSKKGLTRNLKKFSTSPFRNPPKKSLIYQGFPQFPPSFPHRSPYFSLFLFPEGRNSHK